MQKVALSKELGATTYPGRGIVIGRTKDGKKAVTAYFIMGRSANSRVSASMSSKSARLPTLAGAWR